MKSWELAMSRVYDGYSEGKRIQDRRVADVVCNVYRPISLWLTVPLFACGLSANQVTVTRLVMLAPAIGLMAVGGHLACVFGSLLYFAQIMLDYVDGNLARARGAGTRIGALLDEVADRAGQILMPFSVGVGLSRRPDLLMQFAGVFGGTAIAIGTVTAAANFVGKKWRLDRARELAGLLLARIRSKPARSKNNKLTNSQPVIAAGNPPRPRGLIRILRNTAHAMEFGIIICAAGNVLGAYLLFRFCYQVPKTVGKLRRESRQIDAAARDLTSGHPAQGRA